MTPTNKKSLDLEPGFSVAGEPLSCGGHCTPAYSLLRPPFNPQPAGFAFRFCPAFFNSVALGKMSLEASVNPTTSPNRTLNHALRLRPAIPQKFTSSLCILTVYLKNVSVKANQYKNKSKNNPNRIGSALVSPENRAHTHSLMVEKPFSSSCLRSITAVSLKPPPEPFSAAAPYNHQAVRRYRPSANFNADRQMQQLLSLP